MTLQHFAVVILQHNGFKTPNFARIPLIQDILINSKLALLSVQWLKYPEVRVHPDLTKDGCLRQEQFFLVKDPSSNINKTIQGPHPPQETNTNEILMPPDYDPYKQERRGEVLTWYEGAAVLFPSGLYRISTSLATPILILHQSNKEFLCPYTPFRHIRGIETHIMLSTVVYTYLLQQCRYSFPEKESVCK